ncbi:MAG: Thioredoxin, partial [Candidatus Collierbacteria bacterium GW2011_GWC2_43_12]
ANSKVAGDYGVMSIPTVILYEKGKEVARQVGFGGKDAYTQMIEKIIK